MCGVGNVRRQGDTDCPARYAPRRKPCVVFANENADALQLEANTRSKPAQAVYGVVTEKSRSAVRRQVRKMLALTTGRRERYVKTMLRHCALIRCNEWSSRNGRTSASTVPVWQITNYPHWVGSVCR